MSKTVNVERLVENIANNPEISVVVNLAHIDDGLAQELYEYCEQLFKHRLGRAILTIFEECQDLVPQGKSAARSYQSSNCAKGSSIWIWCHAHFTTTPRSREGRFDPMHDLYHSQCHSNKRFDGRSRPNRSRC